MNQKLSKRDVGLIKGAIRRIFSRSELRLKALQRTVVQGYRDPNRPRVTKWSRCEKCQKLTPTYKIEVDHKDPVIPLDSSLDQMTWDELIDRLWCDISNLSPLCPECHNAKTQEEAVQRRAYKKLAKVK